MDQKARERVINLLGMCTSQHDGEVLVAIKKATKMILDAKMSWAEFIGTPVQQSAPEHAQSEMPRHKAMAMWVLDHCSDMLSDKEFDFVHDMVSWDRPTEKQDTWLSKIYRRCGGK